ncbi:MAG: four helix bundle protein [Bacteroidetes bacterium]|nr:four helix bundle protein [Bacteroidota bacterium]
MGKYSVEENPVLKHTFEFSLMVIDFCELLDARKKYALSNQLFKSGTSIGANANEAQHAESKADFINKFKIAAKEVKETSYWLRLCECSEHLPNCTPLQLKLNEIEKIINSILASSKRTGIKP